MNNHHFKNRQCLPAEQLDRDSSSVSVPEVFERGTAVGMLERARKMLNHTAGVTALSAASFFGGSGMVGPTAESARGGMVFSLGDDPGAQQRGSQQAGLYRGNGQGGTLALMVEYDGANGQRQTAFTGTAIGFNSYGALGSIHQIDEYLDLNPVFRVMTGTNYLTDPGQMLEVERVILPDGFVRQERYPNIADLAIFRYATPVNQPEMMFANTRPGRFETAEWAGFGLGGTRDGYFDPDGKVRAGISYITTTPPIDGFDPSLYIRTTQFWETSDELRMTAGDSGSLWRKDGLLLGMGVSSGSSPLSSYGAILDFTNLDIQDRVRSHLAPTAVPEPSTFVLVGGAAALAAASRIRRRSKGNPEDS